MRIHSANLRGNILIIGTILRFLLKSVLLLSFGYCIISESCIYHNDGTITVIVVLDMLYKLAIREQICPYEAFYIRINYFINL